MPTVTNITAMSCNRNSMWLVLYSQLCLLIAYLILHIQLFSKDDNVENHYWIDYSQSHSFNSLNRHQTTVVDGDAFSCSEWHSCLSFPRWWNGLWFKKNSAFPILQCHSTHFHRQIQAVTKCHNYKCKIHKCCWNVLLSRIISWNRNLCRSVICTNR